jgi:hypothetical protein
MRLLEGQVLIVIKLGKNLFSTYVRIHSGFLERQDVEQGSPPHWRQY